MHKYPPNELGLRRIEIIRSYLPDVQWKWSEDAGQYLIINPHTKQSYFINMAPPELGENDLAFFINWLANGKFIYHKLKKEIAYGESKRQARIFKENEDGKELRRQSAHGEKQAVYG